MCCDSEFMFLLTAGLNLATLRNLLDDVECKYHKIGIQLGISGNKIKAIEANYPLVERRLSEVVSFWLFNHPEASWMILIKALESDSIKEKVLAQRIRRKYSTTGPPSTIGTSNQLLIEYN